MRQYRTVTVEKKETEKIVCNKCGKIIEAKNGVWQEETISIEKKWGYFSGKDQEVHRFDLCESCYDEWVSSFAVPIEIEEQEIIC